MSTTFIMGLVGVSIHTSYTKKDRVSFYGNARVEYTFQCKEPRRYRFKIQVISESTHSAFSRCANNTSCYAMIFIELDLKQLIK